MAKSHEKLSSSTSVTNIDVTENQDRAWYFNRVVENVLESDDHIENYKNSVQKEIFMKFYFESYFMSHF